jgi:3-methyladenine DNA glycosylase AlkC
VAEPLKNKFGPEIPARIAGMIASVHPDFDPEAFLATALDGYAALDLTPRGRQIATALRRHLPDSYPAAVDILLASLGPKLETTERFGMAPFLYLPHVLFVAEYGLDHFEPSLHAQYELTQRFSAEFSIRAYLERYPDATLDRLRAWTRDPSPHVRRLVSEGTRPRLPWAPRLRAFQRDPSPVLDLLERLKDDPELYVRRSVANNLNDIGKDHPDLLADVARRWMAGASEERQWIVRHALRSAVKRGEAGALDVLGFAGRPDVSVRSISITPSRPRIGDRVTVAFELVGAGSTTQSVLVDFRIHFVKANGKTSPKVFKLTSADLSPGDSLPLAKSISLADLSTRRHYPGIHQVDLLINGAAIPLGQFELIA